MPLFCTDQALICLVESCRDVFFCTVLRFVQFCDSADMK